MSSSGSFGPDLALDGDEGIGAEELLLDERDARDAGLPERGQDLRGDLLLGRGQDLAALGVGDVVGRRSADQAVPDLPVELAVLDDDPEGPVEKLEDLLVGCRSRGPGGRRWPGTSSCGRGGPR